MKQPYTKPILLRCGRLGPIIVQQVVSGVKPPV